LNKWEYRRSSALISVAVENTALGIVGLVVQEPTLSNYLLYTLTARSTSFDYDTAATTMSTPPASLALMPPVISLNKAFSLALHKGCSAEVLEMLQNELSAQSSVINGKIACKFRYITTDIT
jgi:hypothetical protein